MSEQPGNNSPYKGLQPYLEGDSEFFFGRENDQEIITSNLFASPLTIFYGASGVGKSSVLLAGVLPELRLSERIAVVVFREWQDAGFEAALKREVLKAIGTDSTSTIDLSLELDEFLLACTKVFRGSLFFILDQFEEYFLYHPASPETDRFDASFARTINRAEIRANFLLSMRDDGLSRLDRFQSRIPNLLNNMLRLEHLSSDSARLAISNPLVEYNKSRKDGDPHVDIDNSLVTVLLEDLQTGKVTLDQTGQGKVNAKNLADRSGRIETPFLQVVLTRLWDEEHSVAKPDETDLMLRLATYRALGGATTIVRTHLDKVMATERLRPHRDTAAALFHFLVTPTGMKIAHTLRDLASYANRPAAEIEQTLNELSAPDVRILRPIAPPPGHPELLRYEIFHDVLAPAILDWRARYTTIQERKEADAVAAQERERAEVEARRARHFRRLAYALGLVCVVAFGAMVFAFFQTARASAFANESKRLRSEGREYQRQGEELKREGQVLKSEAATAKGEAKTAKEDADEAQKRADASLLQANAASARAADEKQKADEAQQIADASLLQASVALAQAAAEKKKADEATKLGQLTLGAATDYQRGDKQGSVDKYLELIQFHKGAQSVCQQASVYTTLGNIRKEIAEDDSTADDANKYEMANSSLATALKLFEQCKTVDATTLSGRGDAYATMGNIQERSADPMGPSPDRDRAAANYETAAGLYGQAGDRNRQRTTLGLIVDMFEAGEPERAAQFLEKRLALTETPVERAKITERIGNLYKSADRPDAAIKFFQQAVELNSTASKKAELLYKLGQLKQPANRLAAIEDYQEALGIYLTLWNNSERPGYSGDWAFEISQVSRTLGGLYRKDDKTKALFHFSQALDVLSSSTYQYRDRGSFTDLPQQAQREFIAQAAVLNSLAELSLELLQPAPALDYYKSAATIYTKLERYTEAIEATNAIARIYISQGNQNAADPFLRYARELEHRRDRKQSEP